MTTEELVAIFVGVVTALTTVVGGAIRSNRASRIRKSLAEDLTIYQLLPSGSGARRSLHDGIDRQSAELAVLVLHPMKASVYVCAFLIFLVWGVVTIVYVLEGPGPLLFQAGVGRGLTNWAYLVIGLIAVILLVRNVREVAGQRARLTSRIIGASRPG